jgi:hypothetical protein
VLGRAHGDEVLRGIGAEEALADLVDLAQLCPDVLLAEQRDVEPQVLAEAALHALA